MEYNPVQTNTMPFKDKLLNMLWTVINKTVFRFTPSRFSIFRKYRVFLLRLFGADIDWSVSIHPTAVIDYPWNLSMKKRSSLGESSWAYAMARIEVGDLSCIGKGVFLLTGSHDINDRSFHLITHPIVIGRGCWIATSAIILPNITIGDYGVVAAGAVVCKSIRNSDVVGGNPAKFIKKRIIKD